METDDIYAKQLSMILLSGKYRLTLFDQFQEAFDFFTSSIDKLKENLEKVKNIDEINNLIPRVSCFAEWGAKHLADDSPLSQISHELQTIISTDYQNIKNEYKEELGNIKNKVEFIQQKFEEDTSNYKSIYDEYIQSCKNLEEAASSSDLTAIPPAKERCYHCQCNAAKACEQLGIQRRECALQMEKIMIDFEKLEKENHTRFKDFLQKFCKITTEFGKKYEEISKKALQELDSIKKPHHDEEPEDVEPRDFSDFPPLIFNIFDFVSPKVVFSDDLHATFLQIISPIGNQLLEFTSFDEGERVVLIQKKNDMYLVESEKNGIRMNVPKSNLKPIKDYKRKIFQLDSPMPEFGLVCGSYVIGILELPESNSMRCKTASGDFVEIPNRNLTPYSDKK